MWRAPKLQDVEAPPEFKEIINKSIFYNRRGKLRNAETSETIQYGITVMLFWIFITAVLFLVLVLPILSPVFSTTVSYIIIAIIAFLLISWSFYWWGWLQYEQAWYHFDNENLIFTVIRTQNGQWEQIEVPYEKVDRIQWTGGNNGYAIIHAAGLQFSTTRADSDRFASVTEMWDQLARFDTYMKNWPITLVCPSCDREFGHHIGTAMCPFDEIILIDPSTKGRIDPDGLHPDDYTRV